MNTATITNRVPQIILLYWIIKIASTTLGETGADMFSMTFHIGYGMTLVAFLALFVVFLGIKLFLKRYDPLVYWLVFTTTAIAGTAISDFIDRTMGLGYGPGSAVLLTLLLITLIFWHKNKKTISVEFITSSKDELFYWIAFLIANTLGTAAGDFISDGLGIGFLNSSILIGGLLVIVTLCHYYSKINGVLLFWIAFVFTRPFGAAFGDLLTKPTGNGGLNLGTVDASIFFGLILIVAIAKESKLEKLRKSDRMLWPTG